MVMEIAHFLIKSLGPLQGGEALGTFLSFPLTIVDFNYKMSLEAIEELKRYSHLGVGGRDSTILAFMRHLPSKKIMTHDKAFKKIDWLEVIDPIK